MRRRYLVLASIVTVVPSLFAVQQAQASPKPKTTTVMTDQKGRSTITSTERAVMYSSWRRTERDAEGREILSRKIGRYWQKSR